MRHLIATALKRLAWQDVELDLAPGELVHAQDIEALPQLTIGPFQLAPVIHVFLIQILEAACSIHGSHQLARTERRDQHVDGPAPKAYGNIVRRGIVEDDDGGE